MLTSLRKWVLDGRYRWGTLSLGTGRYGGASIRLVIHAPDATEAARRYARLSRLWPRISAGATAVAAPVLALTLDVPAALTIASMVLLAIPSGVILARIAAPTTAREVELVASVSALSPRDADHDRYDRAAEIAEALRSAERGLDGGELSWARYRAIWTECYLEASGAA